MTNDHTIEDEIQAKGKTAPRVTPADIEANIADEVYFTALDGYAGTQPDTSFEYRFGRINSEPLGLLTFCVLVLRNGFTVTGESACASPENFDAEIGRKIARQNAVAKVWPLMGYALKNELSRPALTEADALADLRGEPRPDWKGYSNEKVPAYTWADVAGYEVFQNDLEHTSVFRIRTKDGNERRVTLNNHTYRGLAEAIPQLVEAMNKPAETAAA